MPVAKPSPSPSYRLSIPLFGNRRSAGFGKVGSSLFGHPADEKTVSLWGQCTRVIRSLGRRHHTSLAFFNQQVSRIGRLCISLDLELGHAHRQRVEALQRLELLFWDATDSQLYLLNERVIVWAALVCVFHFRRQLTGRSCCDCNRVSYYERAVHVFDAVLKRIAKDKPTKVIEAIISCISTGKYWPMEHTCISTMSRLISYGVSCEILLNAMLDYMELELDSKELQEKRHAIRVLYEVLDLYNWPPMTSSAINTVLRLLELYRVSTIRRVKGHDTYSKIRKGLEVCATRIFDHMCNVDLLYVISNMAEWTTKDNLTDEEMLDISALLEYAASKHNTEMLSDTFTSELFMTLLEMVSSENRLVSLLGNRVLHYLLDRNENRLQFDTPKIFFQNTHFNVVLGEYNSDDKNFLRRHRERIHDAFMRAFIAHGSNRLNLDAAYTTICLMVTEVPCGYTAAAIVCLVMNIQMEALCDRTANEYNERFAYHLHATVMSIMSLLCWVHRADEFYTYVNKVMNRRADQAPHLNPPLRKMYSFAQHHVKWNKPELFFEDWEIRYGLWKCFRTGEGQEGFRDSDEVVS